MLLELLSSDPDRSSVADELSLDCRTGLHGSFGTLRSLPYTIRFAAALNPLDPNRLEAELEALSPPYMASLLGVLCPPLPSECIMLPELLLSLLADVNVLTNPANPPATIGREKVRIKT